MANSWDEYYRHYSDWDYAHCFNVRVELRYEQELTTLGYKKFEDSTEYFSLDKGQDELVDHVPKTYKKLENELLLTFKVPYDWSIDTDWEDRALLLLGLKEEWVIDSSVEDN